MRKSRSVAAAVVLGSVGAVMGQADVSPVPGATAIPGTDLCVVDGWEYASRWSTPNNGFVSTSLEDCAMQCQEDAVCTGTTFIVSGSEKNCWFKDWGAGPAAPPCLPSSASDIVYQAIIDPQGATCATIAYMDEPALDCEYEMTLTEKPGEAEALTPADVEDDVALAPVAVVATVTDPAELLALMPPYTAFAGVDYGPLQDPLPAVGIVDILPGLVVANAVECATTCSEDPACNAVSYYGDNDPTTWPGQKNCYKKTLTGCDLPADAQMTDDDSIFLIGGMACAYALPPVAVAPAPTLAAAPPLPMVPVAAPLVTDAGAPTAGAPLPGLDFDPVVGGIPPLSTTDGVGTDEPSDRSFAVAPETAPALGDTTGTTGSVAPATPSGAMGVLPGFSAAACAVVGAALLL